MVCERLEHIHLKLCAGASSSGSDASPALLIAVSIRLSYGFVLGCKLLPGSQTAAG